jgi:hypothetical protein
MTPAYDSELTLEQYELLGRIQGLGEYPCMKQAAAKR